MATYQLDLNDANYGTKVLSYYLWGQASQPSTTEIADVKWINRTEEITLEVDRTQFLQKYGHLFNAKDFKLVEVFFSGETRAGTTLARDDAATYTQNANGEYELTHEQFYELFYNVEGVSQKTKDAAENPKPGLSFYNRGLNDADYARRAFVFGSVNVAIDTDHVKYVLDENFNPLRIEDFNLVINGEREDEDNEDNLVRGDNFDFVGGDGSEVVNHILRQVADPSAIGQTVQLDFGDGAVIATDVLTKDTYDDLEKHAGDDKDMDKFFDEYVIMRDTGVINFRDENDKVVIYGTTGNNNLAGTRAENFELSAYVDVPNKPNWFVALLYDLNHYDDYLNNGITYVGGSGDDIISGTINDDILYGGADKDTLSGGAGDDTIHGGDDVDELHGHDNDDKLVGGDHNDTLFGGKGDDTIFTEH